MKNIKYRVNHVETLKVKGARGTSLGSGQISPPTVQTAGLWWKQCISNEQSFSAEKIVSCLGWSLKGNLATKVAFGSQNSLWIPCVFWLASSSETQVSLRICLLMFNSSWIIKWTIMNIKSPTNWSMGSAHFSSQLRLVQRLVTSCGCFTIQEVMLCYQFFTYKTFLSLFIYKQISSAASAGRCPVNTGSSNLSLMLMIFPSYSKIGPSGYYGHSFTWDILVWIVMRYNEIHFNGIFPLFISFSYKNERVYVMLIDSMKYYLRGSLLGNALLFYIRPKYADSLQ